MHSARHSGIIRLFFLAAIIGVTIVASLVFPAARNSLFNFSFSAIANQRVTQSEELSGIIFVFFKIGICVIYSLIIRFIVERLNKKTFGFILSIIVSILYISSSWTGNGGISRWGLLTSGLASFVVLIKEYPTKKKTLSITWGVAFLIIILVSSITKLFIHHGVTGSDALIEIFSEQYINSYFQGIYLVSAGKAAMDFSVDKIGLVTFLDDTISAYPLINHLFYQSGNCTELYFCNYIFRNDQILPTVAQGYAYFGIICSPFFSIILTMIAFRCDAALRRTKNIYETVALAQIVTWTSLFMAVNVYIIQRTTMYYVILMLILWIDKHAKFGDV